MARFLDNKKDIDKQVKKKKKEETAAKKPQSSSASADKVNKRLSEKYSGGSTGGKVSKPSRSTDSQSRITQKSYGTTKPKLTTSTSRTSNTVSRNNGDRASSNAPVSTNRITQMENERRTKQNTNVRRTDLASAINKSRDPLGIIERNSLGRRYDPSNRATADEAKTNRRTDTRRTDAVVKRLSEKYGIGKVTGGKNTVLDKAASKVETLGEDIGTGFFQGMQETGLEEKRLRNFLSNSSTGNKFYNRELNREDFERNRDALAERDRDIREEITAQKKAMEKTASRHGYVGQRLVGAAQSEGGRVTDAAFGPFSLAHMAARTFAGSLGEVEEKAEPLKKQMREAGYSEDEINEAFKGLGLRDFANAVVGAGIETVSEKMFEAPGLSKIYGKGYLDKFANRVFGKSLGSSGVGRLARGIAGEVAEEEVGNPAQTLFSNLIYGNKFQSINEDIASRSLDELLAASANIDSEDFISDARESFKKFGSSDEEADELTKLLQAHSQALLNGDVKQQEESRRRMVDIIAGGENSVRERWTIQDAVDTAVETAIATTVSGGPDVIHSASVGRTYKENNGIEAVRKLAEEVRNLDTENSTKAQAVIDRIDAGEDISDTQTYEIMGLAMNANFQKNERKRVADNVKNGRMKDEDLRVQPVVMTRMGPQFNEKTAEAYQETFDETIRRIDESNGAIRGRRKHGLETDENETVMSREDKIKAAHIVASYETGVLNTKQVDELSIDNPEVRTAFETMTGVDLSQYIVRDKSGNIDTPASNIRMQEGLFANSAENYVQMARIEQENWNDKARGEVHTGISRGMNKEGSLAAHEVLKAVDPRDQAAYMVAATAAATVYDDARHTNDSWDSVRRRYRKTFPNVDMAALQKVYEAGKADKNAAETPYLGRVVTIGKAMKFSRNDDGLARPSGDFYNESSRVLGGKEDEGYRIFAKNTGVTIRLVPAETLAQVKKDENGNIIYDENGDEVMVQVNGTYNKDGEILLADTNGFDDNIKDALSHEFTHHLAVYAPEAYMALSNYVMDKLNKTDRNLYDRIIKRTQELYKSVGKDLSEEQALEEIIADATRDFWNDPQFVEEVMQSNENNPGIIRSILNMIRDMARRIRNMLSSGNLDEEYEHYLWNILDGMDEAERLWLAAYKQAVKNKAAIGIVNLQERIYEEGSTRHSIGDGLNIQNGNARWTDERIDSLIKEYGASNQDYSQAYAVMMNPRDFLKLTLRDKFLDLWNEGVNSEQHPEVYSLDEEELRNNSQTPFLSIHSNNGTVHIVARVDGHEGRHRMRALMEAGVTSVPVVIQDMDTKYTKKPESWMLLGSQNFGDGPINNKATVDLSDLVPIKESNRDELIQKFGGEADIRFSVSEPVERVKDLIAVHNLKPDDIRNTFDLGGFPMPSIAVTKDSMGHDMYGDITLMFHSDTIDPKKRRTNEVFGGDAYTPVFPRIHYKASSKVEERLSDLYYEWSQKYGYDTVRPFYEYGQTLQDALDRAGGEVALIDQLKSDSNLMRMYLRINDKDVEDVMKITEITMPEGEVDLSKRLIDALGEDDIRSIAPEGVTGREALQYRREWVDAHKEQLEKVYRDYFTSSGVLSEEDIEAVIPEIKPGEYAVAVRKALDYLRHGATTTKEEKDYEATTNAIKQAAEETGYDEWIDDLFKGVEEKRGLRNDRDMFTASGNRRKWESLYEPVTLDGVVRVMSQELSAGANGLLGANPKGASQKSYRSLDEIRADEDRLQQLPEEEFKALEEAAVQKLSDVCGDIVDSNSDEFQNRFGAALDVGEYIAEILNVTKNRATIQRKLQSDYNLKVSDTQMDALMEAIDEIANLPTGYFEAKPRRAVGFDEVKAAIIPASTDEDIKQGFSNRGIQMYEYDPDVVGDRTAKVNEAATKQDIRFSITDSEGAELSEGQANFFEDSKNRDAEGRLKVMLHGTNAEFNEFDPSKAQPGTLGRAFYFSDSASHAGQYGNVGRYYLNLENPLVADTHDITRDQLRRFVAELADNEDYGIENYGAGATVDSVTDSVWGGTDFVMLRDLNLSCVGDFAEALKVFNRINGTDYDGIITAIETVAFYPQQIKRTDNLNPTLNKDTRYSITDSDGNELSEGQVNYFKNSQARDEQGWLVPVYHTTRRGGFTVFDPMKSNDHRSLFFTSHRRMSESYSKKDGRTTNDINSFDIYTPTETITHVYDLGEEADLSNRVSNIKVKNNGKDILAGDDFVEVAKELGRYLESQGYDLFEDLFIDDERLYNNDFGQAWQLFNEAENEDITYTMDYADPVGTYSCYLNLENPLIVDAHDNNWDEIPFRNRPKTIRNVSMYLEPQWGNTEDGDPLVNGYALTLSWEEYDDSEFFSGWDKQSLKTNFSNPNPQDLGWFPREEMDSYVEAGGMSVAYFNEMIRDSEEEPMDGSIKYESEDEVEHEIYTSHYTTREIAEIAQSEGYDGVIIRNVVDYGDWGYGREAGDVYIAFSSNQVKDTRNENPTENPDIRYSITEEEDAMSWLADQYELDDVPLEDEVAEDGRKRMAKSKKDFINSRNAVWNERWLTEGKVLNTKSVEKHIRNLVMGAMANSNTDRQYKKELVDKLVIDAKSAFWLMRDGKHSEASELLWKSAVKMMEDVEFIDDSTFKQYKDLRDYLRKTKIQLGEEYWGDVDYSAFRKRNFGRIKLTKGSTNVDQVYDELQDSWPEWFGEAAFEKYGLKADSVPDILLQIENVLDAIQPYKIAYSSEEAAELAGDFASDLYDIVYEGEEYKSIADTFKQKYDAKTKAMKQRHEEALRKVMENRDAAVAKEKAKFREYKEKKKNAKERAKHFGHIQDNIDWLTNRLVNETKDKNIPEGFRRSLAHLLMQFDMQTERSKKLEEKYGPAKKTLKIRELKAKLDKIAKEDDSGEFRYDGYVFFLMDALAEKVDGKSIDSLDTEDLIVIDTMLKSIRHNFANYNKIRLQEKQVEIASVGDKVIEQMEDRISKYGKRKTYGSVKGFVDHLVNEGETTPVYFFERLDPTGEGMGAMWHELSMGEDKHIRNMNFIRGRMRSIMGDYFNRRKPGSELKAWRDNSQAETFNLANGQITLNPAQIMSLYCLSKREQAMGHMLGAGIVASPVTFGQKMRDNVKGRTEQVDSVMITYDELKDIISRLTPEQIKMADELQSLLNNEMAAWGNETSLEMHGIKLFRETDYFPIKSSSEVLKKSADSFDTAEKIKNFGFTKPLVKNANNAIMIDDIFSVVADHCNKMSLYNAFAIPISDFMRVYNYKQSRDDGSQKTVQQAIGEAFTRKANAYIMKFISDVNGNTKTQSDPYAALMNKVLANYKKAAIGANFRVALQQPTSIFRAWMEIDPKYFHALPTVSRSVMREMFEHCPKALWKSWGHYDVDMGRDIEDIMMNTDWSRWDTVTMGLYGYLDNVAWVTIWQAVKAEVKDKHPELEVGSQEYWTACNERAKEVFDKTQVVDSIFNRSEVMRSKNTMTKMMTSFMAEPTLTYNVLRHSIVQAREAWIDGDKSKAMSLLLKAGAVLAFNAAAVSATAALWDAFRGKGGDDDDEEKTNLWLQNFLQNLADNANPIKNMYYFKDIWGLGESILSGRFQSRNNMTLEAFDSIFTGLNQMRKKISEGSDKSWYDIMMNVLGGIGYATGIPIRTIMRDVKAAYEKLGLDVFADDGTAEPSKVAQKMHEWFGSDDESSSEDSSDGYAGDYTDEQKTEIEKAAKKHQESGQTESRDAEQMLFDAEKAAAGYEGEERNKKIWQSVTKGYTGYIEAADWGYIQLMRDTIEAAGGDVDYFDQQVFEKTKSSFKKSLTYDQSDEDFVKMLSLRQYLTSHGMTEEQISSEIVYKSEIAKDMKVAFRINDENAMREALQPLADAGLTQTDLERLWDNRNRMDLMKYKNDGGRFADRLKSTGTFIWPAQGPITSEFGYRNAPTAGASSNHPAIDIGAAQGSPVVAADGGTVIYAGSNGGYGNSVGIKHDNGMVTYYNHLYSWSVKEGDTVAQGQTIAQVGSTGISTGPHLDFKVLDANGEPVNPMDYLS